MPVSEDRFEKILERVKALEDENRDLKQRLNSVAGEYEESEAPDNDVVSRREFLKGLGTATAGIGALALVPSASANVRITDTGITRDGVFNFWVDGSNNMTGDLTLGGDLTATDGETIWDEGSGHIPQGVLQNLSNFTTDAQTISIQSTEPSNPSDGDIWIDPS